MRILFGAIDVSADCHRSDVVRGWARRSGMVDDMGNLNSYFAWGPDFLLLRRGPPPAAVARRVRAAQRLKAVTPPIFKSAAHDGPTSCRTTDRRSRRDRE